MNSTREIVLRPAPLAQMSPRPLAAFPVEKDLTIRDLWGVCSRQRLVILGRRRFVLAGRDCILRSRQRRLYKATGQVQVQKDSADGLGLDNHERRGCESSDALDANMTLQTQAQVLQSDSLALQVIKEDKLEDNKDFKPKWNPISWAMGLFAPAGVTDPANASLDDSPGRRGRLLKVFQRRLEVKPVPARG